jgi:Domain of unknown function (DUF4389)
MDKGIVNEQLKEHVKDGGIWLRLLFMLLFVAIYHVAAVVLAMVALFQFLFVLFTGNKNGKVLSLGASLSTFIYQVYRYLTFNSEERPFPFADWPSDACLAEQQATSEATPEATPEAASEAAREPVARPAPKRAATRKRTTARKKPEGEEKPASSD